MEWGQGKPEQASKGSDVGKCKQALRRQVTPSLIEGKQINASLKTKFYC
jgi:hypothetical protein